MICKIKTLVGWILYILGWLFLISCSIVFFLGLFGKLEIEGFREIMAFLLVIIAYGFIFYGMIYFGKKLKTKIIEKTELPNEILDDITYIQELKHTQYNNWQQYDILLAAKGYGWEYMKSWANYMEKNDLSNISSITSGTIGSNEKEHIKEYDENSILDMPSLKTEQGYLTVAGHSKVLNNLVKICWFNQCNYFRIFTFCEDEDLIKRYIETMIRRTFNTKNAMKLAKPIPKKEDNNNQVHCFGTYECSDEAKRTLKACSYHYLSQHELYDANYMLDYLSNVMDVSGIKELLNPNKYKDEKERILIISDLIALVEKSIQNQTTDSLKEKVQSNDIEACMKAWVILDYFVWWIKSDLSLVKNIQVFKDYIQSYIFQTIINRKNELMKIELKPVIVNNQNIYLDSTEFFRWKMIHFDQKEYEFKGSILLNEKQPVLTLYDDSKITNKYCLQVKENEDFTNKYFQISVRLHFANQTKVVVAQIDGFVSDSINETKFDIQHIGYRFEGYFLRVGKQMAKKCYDDMKGQDLYVKALRYLGYMTPSNVRLIGICPNCHQSFAFHGYNIHHNQSEPVYSDDGLDTYLLSDQTIDKETWSVEKEGKIFRYYNSFNCPYCKEPYIDYKKYPKMKQYGNVGCVHLGKELISD